MEGFDFNEHVQENAGYYGTVAGISHLRNQQNQNRELQKQRKALEQQVEAAKNKAKTEQDRLKLEQKRFELEKRELELQKQKQGELKELRKLMAKITGELDEMEANHL